MKISCPRCGQSYDIDRTSIGKEADCTNCGNHFVIQATFSKPQKSVELSHCPYCAGELVPGVKKCRHCGEWIDVSAKPRDPVAYIILGLSLGFFALHNIYAGEPERIGIKLIVLFVSIFLICPLILYVTEFNGGFIFFLFCVCGLNEIISWYDIATCHKRLLKVASEDDSKIHLSSKG